MNISIIIPTYNGKKYIEETINSCVQQKCEELDVIIIDDCSTDDSYQYIEQVIECKFKNEKVQLIKNKENTGVLKACNYGASLAKGEFIMFLGHDDILPNGYIDNISSYIKDSVAFVFSNPVIIDSFGKKGKYVVKNMNKLQEIQWIYSKLARTCIIPSTGLIINKKKFIDIGGFDTTYRNYGEWNLWIRLSSLGEVVFAKDVHAHYRRHETNMTNSFMDYKKRRELCSYWNSCRKLALQTLPLGMNDKILAIVYYMFINLKESYIRVKSLLYKNR